MDKMEVVESSDEYENENDKLNYFKIHSKNADYKQSSRSCCTLTVRIFISVIIVLSGIYFLNINTILTKTIGDWLLGKDNHTSLIDQKIENYSFTSDVVIEQIIQDRMIEFNHFSSLSDEKCFNFTTSKDWNFIKTTDEGDTISSMLFSGESVKIFKITGTLDVDSTPLINWLFDKMETSASWNKQVALTKIFYIIDENTDLLYQGSTPLANGAISPRDVVLVRHRGQYSSYIMSSTSSIDNLVPDRKDFVRGASGFACYAARNLENNVQNKCEFNFLINTHLKGWIPQAFTHMFIPNSLSEFMESLRGQVPAIKDSYTASKNQINN